MESFPKRKAEEALEGVGKKTKTKKQWKTQQKGRVIQTQTIQAGDSGVWVTCMRGKEGKSTWETLDLFEHYVKTLYPSVMSEIENDEPAIDDIEAGIASEIEKIKAPAKKPFASIKLNVPCVLFIKTTPPIDPVSLVNAICEDALRQSIVKRTRFVQRLAPMSLFGKATPEGLTKLSEEVLRPHFHQEPIQRRKFAIRTNLRNHNVLKRDAIIQQVAKVVGPQHEVDLQHYDLLILVELYQSVCGMSVVDSSFERLKRYNIAEIFEPTHHADSSNVK